MYNGTFTLLQLMTILERLGAASNQSWKDLILITAIDPVLCFTECLRKIHPAASCPLMSNLKTFIGIVNQNIHSFHYKSLSYETRIGRTVHNYSFWFPDEIMIYRPAPSLGQPDYLTKYKPFNRFRSGTLLRNLIEAQDGQNGQSFNKLDV